VALVEAVFVVVLAGVDEVFAVPDETLDAAALGFAFESADTVVSPVDALSTGDEGVAVIAEAVFVVSGVAVLSVFAASLRAHATARLRTPATTNVRPANE
jgi:hypothetical protein